jgi:hypothetical protein
MIYGPYRTCEHGHEYRDWSPCLACSREMHNFEAIVTSPDGAITHELTYYMRRDAKAALAQYLTYGWSGYVQEIAR